MRRSDGAWRSVLHKGLAKVILRGQICAVTWREITTGRGESSDATKNYLF